MNLILQFDEDLFIKQGNTPIGDKSQITDGESTGELGIFEATQYMLENLPDKLDAYQGAKLKAQIDYVYARLQAVYAALGNIAFWDDKPASETILPNLEWGLPKHTLTLNLTLSHASVKVNGTAYANGDTISVDEYAPLSVLIEPSADYLFNTAPTLTFGGQSVALTANQGGSYSANVLMGLTNATLAVTATASLPTRVGLTMKKVTGYGAQFDTPGNRVEGDDFDTNTIYTDGAYMTLGNLSSSTPECSLSNVIYMDGEPFTTVVNPSSGYGIFSVKVEQNGQDITGNAYTPSNHSINVVAANSTLSITVIVSETTNSFFMGGSFFGVHGGIQSLFEPQKSGQIVTDPDWQCMSEFIPVPANATHVRWWLGDNTHKPYDETQTGPNVCQQRALIFYDENFVPGRSGTYYSVDKPYRDYNMSTFTFTTKYVRASFKTSLLQYAKIQFSTDGTNFTDAWVYTNN